MTVRNTGFIERNASTSLPATVPALARFEAVVLRRTSCADMARPLMSKIERPAAIVILPLARESACRSERKHVVEGKCGVGRVGLGGSSNIKKKKVKDK